MDSVSRSLLAVGGVPGSPANYIEDVFSAYLYSGNGGTKTITTNIDLSTKGGLVWIKGRSGAAGSRLVDTVRGATLSHSTTATTAAGAESTGLTAFSATGFTLGADTDYNTNTATYVAWTFREQAKFFDIVSYTGNGNNRAIAHSLGSVPGCIIIKRTDSNAFGWQVYHRGLANTEYLELNTTAAKATGAGRWNSTTPTATEFYVGTDGSVNNNNASYIAYLFAHDAGGFGGSNADNVISCGSFTTDSGGPASVTLGYEPQFLMMKASSTTGNWFQLDTMRGMHLGANDAFLNANTTAAETTALDSSVNPTATGFVASGLSASATYIYIAVRRGPMRTPTSGSSVFTPHKATGSFLGTIPSGFPADLGLDAQTIDVHNTGVRTRLIGGPLLLADSTNAESTPGYYAFDGEGGQPRVTSAYPGNPIYWTFRRAPGFLDVICWTGDGSAGRVLNHNLGATPELIITKRRNTAGFNWSTQAPGTLGFTSNLSLNLADADAGLGDTYIFSAGSATTLTTGSSATYINVSSATYVAYLFGSVSGVSKVGTYTGNGSSQTINCGFTTGARFVLIKRTSNSGNWIVWDSARGIVSGNDPHLSWNLINVEVTTNDSIDPDNSGFIVNQVAATNINVSSATYIYLAIA